MWIRYVSNDDIKRLAELEKECFSDPWNEHMLKDMVNGEFDTTFVLEDNCDIIGYVNVRIIADQGEVMRIAVEKNRRGEHLSDMLMKRTISFFDSGHISEITLEVRKLNLPARTLYETFGFIEEGMRPGYYHEPEDDAVIYWRRK